MTSQSEVHPTQKPDIVEFTDDFRPILKWHTDTIRLQYYMLRFISSAADESVREGISRTINQVLTYTGSLARFYGNAALNWQVDRAKEQMLFSQRDDLNSTLFTLFCSGFRDTHTAYAFLQSQHGTWMSEDSGYSLDNLLFSPTAHMYQHLDKSVHHYGQFEFRSKEQKARLKEELKHVIAPITDSADTLIVIGNVAGGTFDAGVITSLFSQMYPEKNIELSFAQCSPSKLSSDEMHIFPSALSSIERHSPETTALFMVDHMASSGTSIHSFLYAEELVAYPMLCIIGDTHSRVGWLDDIDEWYLNLSHNLGVYARAHE